jgi:hypothetical protein
MCEWLDEAGIPYRVRVDGKPVLTWEIFNKSILGVQSEEPNLDWFKEAG